MKTGADSLVIMGRIVAPYGVQGWVKVLPDTEALDGLLDYQTWQVGKDGDWKRMKLMSGKVHNDVLVVKLEGVNDRDTAFACKGMQIAVTRDALPALNDEDEFYWSDLIGLAVTNQQGIAFGKIVDVFETGANDVIVVQGETQRLIPFAEHTVIKVDIEQQTMLVDWGEDY
ncbi:MAG: ribosome maturation factor RimM [Methylophilaceae bacterium]|jgi:16S rRNA processing protein RimM|nr:MAG: ribosome maturation factor RimM [Methylophilaceae bacterium]